jgi:large subunit ribosomal protein L13
MKTYSAKPTEVKRQWYVVDASEDNLGRIASKIALLLNGKEKPMFTAHIDCGDYVIVINSDKLKVSGNTKLTSKKYYSHSGHPGGLHTRSFEEQINKDSTQLIIHAVKGMMPNNKLLADRLNRLKTYPNENHNHEAQKPVKLTLKKG